MLTNRNNPVSFCIIICFNMSKRNIMYVYMLKVENSKQNVVYFGLLVWRFGFISK